MNKNRLENIEKQIKTINSEFPAPGFFSKHPNVEMEIEDWRANLLKQGYSIEVVRTTPAFIEE